MVAAAEVAGQLTGRRRTASVYGPDTAMNPLPAARGRRADVVRPRELPDTFACTTADWFEVAGSESPEPFVAVTTTRIVFPASAATSVYVPAVAPLIAAQLAPRAVAALPLIREARRRCSIQLPFVVVSVWPSSSSR